MPSNKHPEILCNIARSYCELTGISCKFYLAGKDLYCEKCLDCIEIKLCIMCQSSSRAAAKCHSLIGSAGLLAYDLCQPYIFMCPLGLIRWAVPVISEKEYLGYMVAGPVRIHDSLVGMEEQLKARLDAFNLSRDVIIPLMLELPYCNSQQIHNAAQILFHSSCYYMETAPDIINRQLKVWNERSALSEEIARLKLEKSRRIRVSERLTEGFGPDKNKDLLTGIFGYNLQTEQELIGRTRLGDRPAVKKILNEILGRILLDDVLDLKLTKALLFELLISVGRAAIQRRTPGDKLFGLYRKAINSLQEIREKTELCSWTIETFDELIDMIYSNRDKTKFVVVEQVISAIKSHYDEDLSIDRIAQATHYSPYYLSRLFKEELGITIIDYLTEVRIAQARRFLENTDMVVDQVARKVGYNDAAYFSRIFKKRVGISPGEYRRYWS